MKIVNDDSSLRIVDASTRLFAYFALLLGAFYVVCIGRTLYALASGQPAPDHLLGLVIGLVICLICGTGFSRKSDFQFDKYARKLIWRRGWPFWPSGGEVPFAEIQEVVVECKQFNTGDGSATGYRLVLRLKKESAAIADPINAPHLRLSVTWGTPKDILPVMEAYCTGTQKRCEDIAARIREILPEPRRSNANPLF